MSSTEIQRWRARPPRRARMRRLPALRKFLATALAGGLLAVPGLALALPEGFVDKEDGAFDISDWLVEKKGFLPIPMIVTEPAVGYGGGVSLLFVRNSIRESAEKTKETGHMVPPDLYVMGGVATENGTRAGFAGGMVSFDDDHWRWRGGVGRTDVNLDFYGIGGQLPSGLTSIAYSLDGWVSAQKVSRRLGESDNWLGARWIYTDFNNKLNPGDDSRLSGLQNFELSRRASGLGLALEHDSRDNIFTPSRGWEGAFDATFFGPAIGSDNTFQYYRAHVFSYWPMAENLILATRVDLNSASGRVPFYMLPGVDLRGVSRASYQDDHSAVGELELRWNVTPRWAAIGFIGGGRAWGRDTDFGDASTAVGKGLGFRYLIARQLGMWVGLDFARGPDGNSFYIQVGDAWR